MVEDKTYVDFNTLYHSGMNFTRTSYILYQEALRSAHTDSLQANRQWTLCRKSGGTDK